MTENVKKLYRSTSDRMIAGICGGMGEYFGIDSTLVRLIFVFGAIFTGSALFWVYIIMLIVIPEEPISSQSVVEVSGQEIVSEGQVDEAVVDAKVNENDE